MSSQKSTLVTFKKGDIVEGKITKLTSSEIRVDINSKAEAVVLEKDRKLLSSILSSFKVGDIVSAQILNVESDMGHPVVSLRRFLNNKLWGKITEYQKNKTVLDVTVNETIKGGLLVTSTEGISGFLPNSQISFAKSNDESPQAESKIKAIILEAERNTGKIIFSQSQSVTSEDFIKSAKRLKNGANITVTITNVTPYGLFVSVPVDGETIDGFIHVSEIAWQRVEDISSQFAPGDTLEAQVLGFDEEGRRVNLSIKKLKSDPFDDKVKEFSVDKKVSGVVRDVKPAGAIVDLTGDIEGFIKKDKIPPTMNIAAGQTIEAVVSGIDSRKRRVELTPVLKEKPLTYR